MRGSLPQVLVFSLVLCAACGLFGAKSPDAARVECYAAALKPLAKDAEDAAKIVADLQAHRTTLDETFARTHATVRQALAARRALSACVSPALDAGVPDHTPEESQL